MNLVNNNNLMMFSDGLKHSFINILIVVNGSVVVVVDQEIKTVYQHLYHLYYLDFIFKTILCTVFG